MLSFLPSFILLIISFFLYVFFTLSLALYIVAFSIVWAVMPVPSVRRAILAYLQTMPSVWSRLITFTIRLTTKTQFEVVGLRQVDKKHSYVIMSNHSSWVDILMMQHVFDPYLPQLRYFMKRQLIWLPLIGQACWLLGYPFMRRYSQEYLNKHPEKRFEDLETTRKTCERFKGSPITLINYAEGTRFKLEKHARQKSPYQYLLRPKAGGISLILNAMGSQIETILDVTMIYSERKFTLLKLLMGKLKKVTVYVEEIPVTPDLRGDYQNDLVFRAHFQEWINQRWAIKDERIATVLNSNANKINS